MPSPNFSSMDASARLNSVRHARRGAGRLTPSVCLAISASRVCRTSTPTLSSASPVGAFNGSQTHGAHESSGAEINLQPR
ncbi:uncharacterized protein BDZ99DRAFT_7507 [Mytilinidion resinicola]|uniref:Uncharacterized protein n=1 Tax=Mytilinidion resinicola TaxID=574789 RepID=A0A6A6Z893_9PEZI|nr:uncharacterized protein BDZ99DRAFT_7507 [Mytilinidion resinicola]KAF2817028.1 hypothetical protein BDZ99DRAFT_7507 [Mytilinidion resinicola]